MKRRVFLHAVAECESNVTQSTMVCSFAGITLQAVPGDQYLTTNILVMDYPQYESLCVSLCGS